MKYFLRKIFNFLIFSIFLISIVLGIWSYSMKFSLLEIPAPELSDSFSLNEKLRFIKNKKIKVLALGSSMTLINIDSKSIIKFFNTEQFVNAGSWGMNIKDILSILKIIKQKNDIDKLVISSNICDFVSVDKEIQSENIEQYLNNKIHLITYIKTFNLKYFIKNYPYLNYTNLNNRHYESLCFDKYGGVPLSCNNFKFDKKRWDNADLGLPTIKNYNNLQQIIEFCKKNQIKLYFFQSPIRNGLLNKKVNFEINKHVTKIRKLLSCQVNVHFINSTDKKWADNLFVDGTHFNEKGSKEYTNYCLSKIKNERN